VSRSFPTSCERGGFWNKASTQAWSAGDSAEIAVSPLLFILEPGNPKPANPPIFSIFTVPIAFPF
jgi:hypothetical protein